MLTVAAVATVTMVSCSSDDLFTSSNEVDKKNILNIVSVETPMEESLTRAAYTAPMGQPVWQDGDALNIYDGDLYKHDTYTYDSNQGTKGVFVKPSTSNVSAIEYAIYPSANVDRTSWSEGDVITARMQIPNYFVYGSDSEIEDGDNKYYVSNLPMWGVASADQTYGANVEQLKYLTSILRVNVPNALGNATFLKIASAAKPLSGFFEANLDKSNAEAVELQPAEGKGNEMHNYIIVDLTNIPSDLSVIYLPVIAGTYAAGDFTISYINQAKTLSEVLEDMESATPTIVWQPVKTYAEGTTFTRGHAKPVTIPASAFGLHAANPVEVNAALAQYTTTNIVNLTATDFTVNNGDATVGNVIKLPSMKAETVNLTVSTSVTNTSNDLTIEDLDVDKPFTGTLVITYPGAATASNITVNLKSGSVVINGAATNGWTPTITSAKAFAIGDGETATKSTAVTVAKLDESLKIAANATVAGNITLPNTVSAATELDIVGAITGDVNADKATVNMTGTTDAAASITGNLTASGNVNIELTKPAAAVTGNLTMLAANKTLTLKQGYIGTLISDVTGLAIADTKKLTVDFPEGEGFTAIKAVTDAGSVIVFDESVWNNAFLTGPDLTTLESYIASNAVYTASQFATYMDDADAAVTIDLKNDIDLNNGNKWTAPIANSATAAAATIIGNNHKISNLDMSNYAMKVATKGVGLFGVVTDLTVSDLTLDNVKFTKAYNNEGDSNGKTFKVAGVGALAGQVSGDVSISNVTVNLADNFGYSGYTASGFNTVAVDAKTVGVGGLIGIAKFADNKNITLTKTVVNGLLIQGYTSLGGFIGLVANIDDNTKSTQVTINADCVSNITAFKSNYSDPSASNIEMNYGRIAGGIGYVACAESATPGTSSANVSVDVKAGATTNDVAVTLPSDGEGKLYVSVSAGSGVKLWSWARNQQWVGFSASEADPTYAIGTFMIGSAEYVTQTLKADGTWNNAGSGKTAFYTWTPKAN